MLVGACHGSRLRRRPWHAPNPRSRRSSGHPKNSGGWPVGPKGRKLSLRSRRNCPRSSSQTSLPYPRFLVPPPLCLSSERAEEWRDLGNWGKRRGAGGNLCPSAGAMSTPSVEARVSLQPRCKENPRRQRGFTHLWCSSGQPGARGLSGPRAPNCLTRQPGAFGIGFDNPN